VALWDDAGSGRVGGGAVDVTWWTLRKKWSRSILATTSTELATATSRLRSILKGHRPRSGDQKQPESLRTQALSCCRTAVRSHGLADWRLPRFVSAGIEFRWGARSRLPADGPNLDLQQYLRPFSYPERPLNILQSQQVVSEPERKAFPTSRFTTSLQAVSASTRLLLKSGIR
jgi:hypothetical protein